MKHALLALVLACSSSQSGPEPPTDPLEREANAVVEANLPAVDGLSDRITVLKHGSWHNRPGWEEKLRTAQLANDELGRWPYEQIRPPIPGWQPSPASLLGMAGVVRKRAHELAQQGKTVELHKLIEETKHRYAVGIASVDGHLREVEDWVKTAP